MIPRRLPRAIFSSQPGSEPKGPTGTFPEQFYLVNSSFLNVFLTFFSRNYMHFGKNLEKNSRKPNKKKLGGWIRLSWKSLQKCVGIKSRKKTRKNTFKKSYKMKTQFFSDPPEGQVRLRDLRPLAYRGKSGFLGSHLKTDSRKCSLFLS